MPALAAAPEANVRQAVMGVAFPDKKAGWLIRLAQAVTERGVVTGAPARIRIVPGRRGSAWCAVAGWAGPWPVEERWWLEPGLGRSVRFQLVGIDGRAWLAIWREGRDGHDGGEWLVEAAYE